MLFAVKYSVKLTNSPHGPRDTHVAQIWSSYQVKYDKQRIKSKYTLTLKKESKMGRKRGIANFLASIFDFIV